MRIDETITIRCRPSAIWDRVCNPSAWPEVMDGVTRCDRVGTPCDGVGDRYSLRMRVGPAEVGGIVEIVECAPRRDLAWTSITGIGQRGRWRLRETEPGVTAVTLRLAYQSPGGVWGVLADRVSAPQVQSASRRTLSRLREELEGVPSPRSSLSPVETVGVAIQQLNVLRILGNTGLLRPSRPDRLLAAALSLRQWGFTLPGAVAVNAARFPDATAIIDDRGSCTYADLERRSSALANGLAALGVGEGDHVGLLTRNHRGFVEAALAAGKLGADLLLLNTGFAPPQLAVVARREDVVAMIHDAEFAELVGESVPENRRIVAWEESEPSGGRLPTLEQLVSEGDPNDPPPPDHQGRITILTSGTTGAPKGASRSQPKTADPLVSILSRIPLRARETTLIGSPLFHAWGIAHLGLGTLLGSKMVLQRRFDPEATLAAIAEHRVTVVTAVPVMLQRILELPESVRRRHDTSSLRVVAVSGSQLSGELASRFMDAFGDVVYNLYGSTEVSWATIATPEDMRAAPGTAGRPPFGTVVRLLDEHGNEVPPGQTGRIFVGNSMLFEGYTGGGSKDVVDGMMATGDVGRFDDEGRLFVGGRDDEMIVSGGENVFPQEVEEVIALHPNVAEVAVVGVADEEWGQRLAAFVVARTGAQLSEDAVKQHVKSSLARYKVPRDVTFVDALPRNATGKVVKSKLRMPEATTTAPRGRRSSRRQRKPTT
jgi:fatty-acyl-CoA synthase